MKSFMEIGPHFLSNLECRETDAAAWTDRRGNFIYIDAHEGAVIMN